ncbi:PIN domain-containing protein [Edaphobacter aggregans]|uniref:PIN domain-containing protein n=1 Tax=Edaphobacter aggregans TaxID=570835 RepID=UPI000690DBA6|nr:PIN domain-containing protein [Edaphobacter aggregans]
MADKFTLDTNILIYAIDSSQGNKHTLAGKLLVRAAIMRQPLMLQSLNEFAAVVTRKRLMAASQLVKILQYHEKSFPIVSPLTEDLFAAVRAQQSHNLSFFDALLWATAKRAGCHVLLTEDFQDGRSLEGVDFINPFKMTLRELKSLIANI